MVVFYPDRAPDPDGPLYHEYCMYALIKWKPWEGDRFNACGDVENPSDDYLKREWEAFAIVLLSSGQDLPDSFHRGVRFAAREVARLEWRKGGGSVVEFTNMMMIRHWMTL